MDEAVLPLQCTATPPLVPSDISKNNLMMVSLGVLPSVKNKSLCWKPAFVNRVASYNFRFSLTMVFTLFCRKYGK